MPFSSAGQFHQLRDASPSSNGGDNPLPADALVTQSNAAGSAFVHSPYLGGKGQIAKDGWGCLKRPGFQPIPNAGSGAKPRPKKVQQFMVGLTNAKGGLRF